MKADVLLGLAICSYDSCAAALTKERDIAKLLRRLWVVAMMRGLTEKLSLVLKGWEVIREEPQRPSEKRYIESLLLGECERRREQCLIFMLDFFYYLLY